MLLLDTERVALQALFDMIRRYKVGFRHRAAQAHRRARPAVADRARFGGRWREAGDLASAEHSSAPVQIDSVRALAVRTDLGVDLFCEASDRERLWEALRGARRHADRAPGGRVPAHRKRAPALRARPRRHRDPPGGGPQRARRQLHQGLLRGTGDGRPAPLQGPPQPPPARAAPVGAGAPRQRAAPRRARGGSPGEQRPLTARSARSRWRSSAARPSRAARWRWEMRASPPELLELPFPRGPGPG